MHSSNDAKSRILAKIRTALSDEPVAMPFPELEKVDYKDYFYQVDDQELLNHFEAEYVNIGGNFTRCGDINDLKQNLKSLFEEKQWKEVLCAQDDYFTKLISPELAVLRQFDLRRQDADACITDCELAIARTGSILLSSKQNYGRTAPIFFPVHILILTKDKLVPDIQDGLLKLQRHYGAHKLPSMINLNTGASRTSDIEKTLVKGIHGPKEVFCFYIENL